jgi:hypothetical protein
VAGASAYEQAALHDDLADSLEAQIRPILEVIAEHRSRARRMRVGGAGEAAVAARVEQVLVDLGSTDWHLLADRRWPGTRKANLDLVLVGPPGVLVLDSKKWREPRIERGSLWNADVCEDDQLDGVRAQADALSGILSAVGLAPTAVLPMLVLAGRKLEPVPVRGVTVVGERSIQRALVRLGQRLAPGEVRLVTEALDGACPPATAGPARSRVVARRPEPVPGQVPAQVPAQPRQTELVDVDALWTDLLDAAAREPMESWMTWLHPAQAQLVTRSYTGPARIRGAAGTGKTVVALHRVRHLARQPGAKVLVTSFVKTLAQVHRSLFERLAPDETGRVEFAHVHSWALSLLRQRGQSLSIAPRGARPDFDLIWRHAPQRELLLAVVDSADYWHDEVQAVIRGRGLTRVEDYLALTRVGRRTPLQENHRRMVWKVAEAYRERLVQQGTADFHDVIDAALASLRKQPLDQPYTAVVVDEVQDLSCQQLRLLHALVGDRPDGLFLVGDGQQAVYAGGFTLAEAGVAIPGGRSTVLRSNYRNRAEILRAALDVVSSDQFDDLDGDPELGQREVEVVRDGGQVLRVVADEQRSLVHALHNALTWAVRDGLRPGDLAVLVRRNADVDAWCRELSNLGIATQPLKDYAGVSTDAVKIGTYQRAKGLEFACVFIPRYDEAVPPQGPTETEAAYRERAELQRRQLFVAMTRARDRLWLGACRRQV